MSAVFLQTPKRLVDVTIDGQTVRVPEGATLLDACRQQGIDTPTICYLENLTPVNVCLVCVVELEGGWMARYEVDPTVPAAHPRVFRAERTGAALAGADRRLQPLSKVIVLFGPEAPRGPSA